MIVDLKTGKPVDAMPHGTITGTLSWRRLIGALRQTDEFTSSENVTHVSVDLTGLHFRVERRNDEQSEKGTT